MPNSYVVHYAKIWKKNIKSILMNAVNSIMIVFNLSKGLHETFENNALIQIPLFVFFGLVFPIIDIIENIILYRNKINRSFKFIKIDFIFKLTQNLIFLIFPVILMVMIFYLGLLPAILFDIIISTKIILSCIASISIELMKIKTYTKELNTIQNNTNSNFVKDKLVYIHKNKIKKAKMNIVIMLLVITAIIILMLLPGINVISIPSTFMTVSVIIFLSLQLISMIVSVGKIFFQNKYKDNNDAYEITDEKIQKLTSPISNPSTISFEEPIKKSESALKESMFYHKTWLNITRYDLESAKIYAFYKVLKLKHKIEKTDLSNEKTEQLQIIESFLIDLEKIKINEETQRRLSAIYTFNSSKEKSIINTNLLRKYCENKDKKYTKIGGLKTTINYLTKKSANANKKLSHFTKQK